MYGSPEPAASGTRPASVDAGGMPATFDYSAPRSSRPPRPRASWRQVGPDLLYLWPGLFVAIASFVVLVTGFWLGVGLIPLALLGLVILLATLLAGRGFAAAERGRVALMEGRRVGPVYYSTSSGSGLSRLFGYLRDPQLWRDFLHGIVILFVRVLTWSFCVAWTAGSLMITYPLWAWSIPRGTPRGTDSQGLADLIFGWSSFTADVVFNTLLSVLFIVTLPYMTRALATIESSLAWVMLTNENAAWKARAEGLARSRQAVVQAEADTLRRVERDIHDGPQQRLVRLTMDLQSAQRRLGDDPDAAGPLVEGALRQTQEALTELRALSRGIAPPILTDRGLKAALAAAAGRNPIPTTLDIRLDEHERLSSSVENAAYFVVTESLANAAKHSGASHCQVTVVVGSAGWPEGRMGDAAASGDAVLREAVRSDAVLSVQVSDDGRGGAHLGKGHGLAGLEDRLAGVDGQLSIDSPPGGGTTISAIIPIPG